jgi:hypothetical protein
MRQLYIFFLLLPACLSIHAQDINQSYLHSKNLDSLGEGAIRFRVENNNFLKNNEYFNHFTEGITYFGSQIQPELTYAFSDKARLTAGCFLRYYYGKEKFNSVLPVFTFDYNPLPGVKLTIGQLNGLLAHRLIEPIYSTDNYFKRNPENGIEFDFNRSRIQSGIWISWDHFILPGDNSKEEISGGLNTSWKILAYPRKSNLRLNVQAIIHHYGGQVDASDSPLETRVNIAPGLVFRYWPTFNEMTSIVLSSYLVQAADQSGTVTIPYKKGWASYSYILLNHRSVSLLAAWFHGEYYFAPLGDHMFQSVSELTNWYAGDTRNLLNGKFLFDHSIAKGVNIGVRLESYYDPDKRQFDFCYGMNIKADADWLLNPRQKRNH